MSSTLGNIRRLVHWYRRRFATGAVILLYHRIIDLPSDPYLLSVSPTNFAEHLAVLRNHAHPMSLRELMRQLRNGKIPRRAVVLTFDDGYFDNFIFAKPLLEHYDTPATMFIAPGASQGAGEFWWDVLERILLQTRSLPPSLRLIIGGVPHEWALGPAAECGPDDDARYRSWNYGRKDDPTPRHAIFRSMHLLLKGVDEHERRKVLQDLTAWACADASVHPSYRMLSARETVRLAEGGLVEVGAHTMTHPVLSKLSPAGQQDEIRQSKLCLEEILGRPVSSFAYPHGLDSDFTLETMALVREAGFDCACSAVPGIIHRGASAYRLPRVAVRDEGGDQFAERLSGYFGG